MKKIGLILLLVFGALTALFGVWYRRQSEDIVDFSEDFEI